MSLGSEIIRVKGLMPKKGERERESLLDYFAKSLNRRENGEQLCVALVKVKGDRLREVRVRGKSYLNGCKV